MNRTYSFKSPLQEKQLFLNKFNPILKIICFIFILVLVFLPVTLIGQASILILLISLWFSAKIPARKLKPIFKTLLALFIFLFIISWLANKNPGIHFDLENHYQLWGKNWTNLFNEGWVNRYSIDGHSYYWIHGQIWGGSVSNDLSLVKPTNGSFITITYNGIKMYLSYTAPIYSLSSFVLITSISMCIKLFCMLLAFSLLVNTTSTLQLTYGFEHILWPLKWIKVPVTEISYIISAAIGFVPTLLDETNKIMRAQANRGLDYFNGRIFTRIKVLATSIVPVFASAFNHGDKLSDAMEARNFVPSAKRTKYRHYHCPLSNWASFAILCCLLALFIYFNIKKVIIYPFIRIDLFNI